MKFFRRASHWLGAVNREFVSDIRKPERFCGFIVQSRNNFPRRAVRQQETISGGNFVILQSRLARGRQSWE